MQKSSLCFVLQRSCRVAGFVLYCCLSVHVPAMADNQPSAPKLTANEPLEFKNDILPLRGPPRGSSYVVPEIFQVKASSINLSSSSVLPTGAVDEQKIVLSGGHGSPMGAARLPSEKFEVISPGRGATHAVILVGGIHGSYHFFDKWVPELASEDTVVLGWDHSHQAMSMAEAAHLLAQEIFALRKQGITAVTLVAHSMGGLVSKGAVDELSRTGRALDFDALELQAFGTPWGGFAIATLVGVLPGSEYFSRAMGYPMAKDIGPNSMYMQSLAQPMPINGKLRMYVGTTDDVALPGAWSTKARYASIEVLASASVLLNNFSHDAYNSVPAYRLNQEGDSLAKAF